VFTCRYADQRWAIARAVAQAAKRAAAARAIPAPPESLGGKGLAEFLEAGELKVQIDPKFPQAVGIANILGRVAQFGNCQLDILKNEESDCPYFTTDFSVGNEASSDERILNRVLPLTPAIAIRIRPAFDHDPNVIDFEFEKFSFTRRYLRRQEAVAINRLRVQSAEDTVFFRDDQPWVERFIEKNRHFRVDTQIVRAAAPGGPAHFRQRIVAFQRG
jgi:hypothetical protein